MITDHNSYTIPLNSKKIYFINVFDLIKKYNVAALTPYNLKPVLFYLFLKELKKTNKYKNILLTDVDVVFQNDPFVVYNNNFADCGLVLGEERHFYKDCETNSIWFKQGYNEYYDQVKDKKILNCGVTIGPIDELTDYQKKVAMELGNVLARQNYFAYDQVILNHLTYVTETLKFKTLSHLNDYIVHLSQQDEISDLSLWIKNNIVYNPETNNPFTIIHQFDKKKGLKEFIFKKYE